MLLRWKNTTVSAMPFGELHHALCHIRVGLNNMPKEFSCKETSRHICLIFLTLWLLDIEPGLSLIFKVGSAEKQN